MSKPSKQVKLVIKDGGVINAIYDDSLVALMQDAESIHTMRASHVEPHKVPYWQADLRPVGGPVLSGFTTRQAALDAEVEYLSKNVIV